MNNILSPGQFGYIKKAAKIFFMIAGIYVLYKIIMYTALIIGLVWFVNN